MNLLNEDQETESPAFGAASAQLRRELRRERPAASHLVLSEQNNAAAATTQKKPPPALEVEKPTCTVDFA